MSKRSSILKALAEKLKELDGTLYTSNVNSNVFPKLRFWDEVNNFPSIYMSPGTETREYMPSEFSWGFLPVSVKIYCKGEASQDDLEQLLEDIEALIDGLDGRLVYNTTLNHETSEISITSITTDEGLLAPYAVAELNLMIRYQIMK